MGLLIRGGRVIDPASGTEATADLVIRDGRIQSIDQSIPTQGHEVIEAHGLMISPGLVDMHVHLRDPGQTHKEDIASGTAAAVRGGFTSVACMANTAPPIDHPAIVEYVRSRADKAGACRVYPIGAITQGLRGEALTPMSSLAASGAVAFSDDGAAVPSAGLLRQAMISATEVGVPIIEHCEDLTLSAGGVMHEGLWSTVLGLRGIPALSEAVIVTRDLLLAEETGARLHVAHVSTAGTVRLIREARRRGVRVTAEVTPHHLVLSDESVQGYDTNMKMNPPLRSAADVAALREGLADGTIDAIATDHAPHAVEEKLVEFDYAPFGVVGLETALGIVLTHLVRPGILTLVEALHKMSATPAGILGLPAGRLEVGAAADLTLIDPDRRWTVHAEQFASRSRNTPFAGWELQGKVVMTIVGGQIRHNELLVEERA